MLQARCSQANRRGRGGGVSVRPWRAARCSSVRAAEARAADTATQSASRSLLAARSGSGISQRRSRVREGNYAMYIGIGTIVIIVIIVLVILLLRRRV
jgi:hypothetical protein